MDNSIKSEIVKILGVLSLLEKDGDKIQNDLIDVARESAVKILNKENSDMTDNNFLD